MGLESVSMFVLGLYLVFVCVAAVVPVDDRREVARQRRSCARSSLTWAFFGLLGWVVFRCLPSFHTAAIPVAIGTLFGLLASLGYLGLTIQKGYCELKPAREDEFEEQYGLRRTE